LPTCIEHEPHAILRGFIDKGCTWVKLSGAYSNTGIGPPSYPGMPDSNKPDDALLFDLLSDEAPDEVIRHHILMHNPQVLYGFAKSA